MSRKEWIDMLCKMVIPIYLVCAILCCTIAFFWVFLNHVVKLLVK